jgi:hypothetical protein
MKRSTRALATCLFLVAVTPRAALAQASKENADAAQKLFDEALALMKAGKYAEACPRLAKSQKLDPGMGTKFRLAECYESAGLVGSAYQLFREVAGDASKAGRADREKQAQKRVAALEARVPWMTLVVPPEVAGLAEVAVKRDGEGVDRADWGRKMPVDPGAHTLVVSAPGKKPWQTTVRALEGGSLEVHVTALQPDAGSAAPAGPAPAAADAPSPGKGQRIAGIAVGAAGIVGVAVGAALGGVAKSKWDSALAGCQGGDKTRCSSTAIEGGSSAAGLATGSTVSFIAGGALVATGLIVLLTAPSRKDPPSTGVRFVPVVGPSTAFGALEGRF